MNQPQQPVRFRLARLEDAEALLELSRRTVIDTFAHHNDPEDFERFLHEHYRLDLLRADLSDQHARVLIGEIDAVPAAYARMRGGNVPACIGDDGAMQIERFYVDKPHLGRGIGDAMMTRCLQIAREGAHQTVFLGVWEHNARAIRFYQRWSFTRCGEHEFMVGSDRQIDWWMRRSLRDERTVR